jgi:hypothetical protein
MGLISSWILRFWALEGFGNDDFSVTLTGVYREDEGAVLGGSIDPDDAGKVSGKWGGAVNSSELQFAHKLEK